MTPEEILSHPPRVLTEAQRESYFNAGYCLVADLIPHAAIDRLNEITDAFIERSRALTEPDAEIDVAPGHTAERPLIRRLKKPDGSHPEYWDFATGVIADVAADLLGPDVRFHHSKLNFKWGGEDEVKWHQDIPFYPHTNYGVLAIGTYLEDVAIEDGPVGIVPGSHKGPIYEHFDDNGVWTGALRERDAAGLDHASAVYLPGTRGSITVHNARAVHGTRATTGKRQRRLLINAYAAADAFPYTTPRIPTPITAANWCAAGPRPGYTWTRSPARCRPTGRRATPRSSRTRTGPRPSPRRAIRGSRPSAYNPLL